MPDQQRAVSPESGTAQSAHHPPAVSPEAQESQPAGASPALSPALPADADPALREQALLDMQSTHGNMFVQRALHPSPVVQRDHHDRPAVTLPEPATEFVTFETTRLSTDRVQVREVLEQRIAQHGTEATERFITRFRAQAGSQSQTESSRHGMAPRYRPTPGLRIIAVVDGAMTEIRRDAAQLITRFEREGLATLGDLLGESERIIRGEQLRYGVVSAQPLGATMQAPRASDAAAARRSMEQVRSGESVRGLRVAAAALLTARGQYEERRRQRDAELASWRATHGMAPSRRSEGERAAIEERFGEAQSAWDSARALHEGEFPILAAYSNAETSEGLRTLATSGGDAIAGFVGPEMSDRLRDIAQMRQMAAGGDLPVWRLPRLVDMTRRRLSVAPGTAMARMIEEEAERQRAAHAATQTWVAVFALALGLIGAIPTGGASMGVAVGVATAAVGSLALGTYLTATQLAEYRLQAAASGTSLDRARAISQEQPSAFWLAVAIVGTVLDLGAAVQAFRGIAAARTLVQLEQAARAQARALAGAGQLGGISEEVFVERIMNAARRNARLAGSEAAARTGILTELTQGTSPRMALLREGNQAAWEALVREHGNWRQLMDVLQAGSPEMRALGAQGLRARARVLGDVDRLFQARPVGTASTELISDVDLNIAGADAGARLIRAEEYMARRFGANWSAMWRMNFYTEARRITLYEEVMQSLSAAQRADVQRSLTGLTEQYNYARMLAHAGDDAAAQARVLQRIPGSVDLERVRELARMDEGARLAQRNRLLLEQDDAMRRYGTLAPDSPERAGMAGEISRRQVQINFLTEEAYIGPGAVRATVSGTRVVGQEAYQAALSNWEMVEHVLHQAGGDPVRAAREYELYKYINRFTEAARAGGSRGADIDWLQSLSGYVYRIEREAQGELAHVVPPRFGGAEQMATRPVTDAFLRTEFGRFDAVRRRVLPELRRRAMSDADEWAAPAARSTTEISAEQAARPGTVVEM